MDSPAAGGAAGGKEDVGETPPARRQVETLGRRHQVQEPLGSRAGDTVKKMQKHLDRFQQRERRRKESVLKSGKPSNLMGKSLLNQ